MSGSHVDFQQLPDRDSDSKHPPRDVERKMAAYHSISIDPEYLRITRAQSDRPVAASSLAALEAQEAKDQQDLEEEQALAYHEDRIEMESEKKSSLPPRAIPIITVTPSSEIKTNPQTLVSTDTPTIHAVAEIERGISILERRITCYQIALSLARSAELGVLIWTATDLIDSISTTTRSINQAEAIARHETQIIIDGMIANRTSAVQSITNAFQSTYVVNNVTFNACSQNVIMNDNNRNGLSCNYHQDDGECWFGPEDTNWSLGNQQLSHMLQNAICAYTLPPNPFQHLGYEYSIYSSSFTLADYDAPSFYHNIPYLRWFHEKACHEQAMDCNDFYMTDHCSGLISNYCDVPRLNLPGMPSLSRFPLVGLGCKLAASLIGILVESINIVANDFRRRGSWPNLFGFIPLCFNTQELQEIAKKYNIRIESDARNTLDNFRRVLAPLTIIESVPGIKSAPRELHVTILSLAGFFPYKNIPRKDESYEKYVKIKQMEQKRVDAENQARAGLLVNSASNARRFLI